jgi:hypothetical protein
LFDALRSLAIRGTKIKNNTRKNPAIRPLKKIENRKQMTAPSQA